MKNILNIITDAQNELYPNKEILFEVKHPKHDQWLIYMDFVSHSERNRAKIEFMVYDDSECAGSVLRFGNVPRTMMTRVMDYVISKL
jgi:hypothetical protein